jgi:hypothetical protein
MGTGPVDLAELTRRGLVRPASATRRTATIDQMLPVDPLLAPLLRHPGLVPGDVLSVARTGGGTSLLLALAAAAARAGAYVAAIGTPILTLAAVAMGIPSEHLPLIPHPGPDPLAIVAAAADGIPVVIAAGLRDHHAVLLVHGDGWPQPTASLRTEPVAWQGLGQGRGRLRSRTLTITSTVRGDPRPRHLTVLLPDPTGRVAAAVAEPARRVDPAQWWSRTHRVLDTPIPVWVRCEQVFQPRPATYRGTAIRVVAYGIDISHIAPGQLFGWYRLDIAGPYWGLVEFAVVSRNGSLRINLRQLVPAAALSPRTTNPT